MIIVRNDFHDSSVTLKATIGDELSPSQIRRSQRELCGIANCTCGGPLGERGPQDGFAAVQIDHDRIVIQEA